jgi:ubiquinone/menaquinone biosynthesis C-methylase UbiE
VVSRELPVNPPGAVSEFFDLWATNGRAEEMEAGHRPRALTALAGVAFRPTDQVLDVGCGNGWMTRWIHRRVPEGGAVGVDLSPEMVARARALSEGVSGLRFEEGSLERLPFADDTFDHVVSMETFYYADDLAAALAETVRVLRPGGGLSLCIDYYEDNPHSHDWPCLTGLSMKLMSEAQWRDAVRDAGLLYVHSFRCLDPGRAGETDAGSASFTEDVGTLVIRAVAADDR